MTFNFSKMILDYVYPDSTISWIRIYLLSLLFGMILGLPLTTLVYFLLVYFRVL